MFSLNRVQLIGYQTQGVDVRQTPQGTSVTDLNIIVPYQFQSESGEMLTGKGFHTATLWGPMAQVAGQFVKPGSQLFLAGRLQTDSWEDEQSGEKRSKTKLVAQEMILLDPKDGQLTAPAGAQHTLRALNKADIIGNATREPEVRTTTSGQKVVSLGVASNERWKDKTTGEQKERTEFHNVVIWGDLAEEVAQCVKKGNKVFVSGRVQTRAWETQSGSKRTTTEIVADTLSLLGVENAVAKEVVSADSSFSAQSQPVPMPSTAEVDSTPPAAEAPVPAVPDINYESEIKVEDLPF